MNIGDKITALRKAKKISQADLAKEAGVSREIIGRYERNEVSPSVDVAKKIADALDVTLDYLVKDAEYQNIDQDALTRLKLIEKMPQDERSHLFATMDAFFAKNKQQALLK